MPMFLFSGTFYPITAYPPALQVFVQCTPLYRGVHLIRALTTARRTLWMVADVVYPGGDGLIGLAIVSKRLNRLLLA